MAGRTGILSARLPSGDIVDVEDHAALTRSSGLTVVSLPAAERGYELADASPAPSDTVLVNGEPPVVVAMDELAALDVDEGTPVLDDDGDLVGLCTAGEHGTALRPVATMPPTTARPTTSDSARDAGDRRRSADHDRGEHDDLERAVDDDDIGRPVDHRPRLVEHRQRRRRQRRTRLTTTPVTISDAATMPVRASSWRRFGVIIVHHRASVPSTKACSLVTVGRQPFAFSRSLATSHGSRV